jgi:hypothetical protein
MIEEAKSIITHCRTLTHGLSDWVNKIVTMLCLMQRTIAL